MFNILGKVIPKGIKEVLWSGISGVSRRVLEQQAKRGPCLVSQNVKTAFELKIDQQRVIQTKEQFPFPLETDKPIPLSSRELFSLDGKLLPCWRDEDLILYDDWLEAADYYPKYFSVFSCLAARRPYIRFLEIGVRTGYMAVAFCKAVSQTAMYVGIDPNLYVANGLQLASSALQMIREQRPHFNFMLLNGYSWQPDLQRSLEFSGPFDLIHIDGDHSLLGKLVDLELAGRLKAADGIVLVDDFDHHPPVSIAVGRAITAGWYSHWSYIKTKRGLCVLR